MFLSRIETCGQTRNWCQHGDGVPALRTGFPDKHVLAALLGAFARAEPAHRDVAGLLRFPEHPVEVVSPTADPKMTKTQRFAVHPCKLPWPDFADVAGGKGFVVGEHFLKPIERVPSDWRRT